MVRKKYISLEEEGDEQKKELTGIMLKSNLDAGTLILLHDLIESIEDIIEVLQPLKSQQATQNDRCL